VTEVDQTEVDRIAKWLIRKHYSGGSGASWAQVFAKDIAEDVEGFAQEALDLYDPYHDWCHYSADEI
jgi:hypothetical protein